MSVNWPQACYHCGNEEAGDLRQTFVGPWCCLDKDGCMERRRALDRTFTHEDRRA